MSHNKIKPKFYVYGCDQLLNDLQELILEYKQTITNPKESKIVYKKIIKEFE